MAIEQLRPSYKSGFAPRDFLPKHPDLWKGCIGAWCPSLGSTGTVVKDWSKSGINGTLTGSLSIDTGWSPNGIKGNGSTGAVSCGTGYNPGLESWSQSAWYKHDAAQSLTGISGKSLFAAGAGRYGFYIDSNVNLYAFVEVSAGVFVTNSYTITANDGIWHSLVWTVNRTGNAILYFDGKEVSSVSASAHSAVNITSAFTYNIAAYNDAAGVPSQASTSINGFVDDIRHYNRVLSPYEAKLLASQRGIAYYPEEPLRIMRIPEVYSETASGGVVCGSTATVDLTYSATATGGVVCGGATDEYISQDLIASGGIVIGSTATVQATYDVTPTGGVVCGGDNGLIYDETASGGVLAGSSATPIQTSSLTTSGGVVVGSSAEIESTADASVRVSGTAEIFHQEYNTGCCGFVTYDEESTGGIEASGTATVTDSIIQGGVSISGTAEVDCPTHVFNGYSTVLHLLEDGDGTTDEFFNEVGRLHGTGGALLSQPTQVNGLFDKAQLFDGNDFIYQLNDGLNDTEPFTVSLWAQIEGRFLDRTFYSRGTSNTVTGEGWSITLGHDASNRLVGKVQVIGTTDWETYTLKTTRTLPTCWTHVALKWNPGETLKLYINGFEEATTNITETELVPSTGRNYIGRENNTRYANGNIGEVRVTPELKSDEWIYAEYKTMCENFVTIGSEETSIG